MDDELAAYVDRSRSVVDSSAQLDEEEIRRELVEPLLELLGWNTVSRDVALEYSVRAGVGEETVDYALMLDRTPVVFVEMVGPDSSISDFHRSRLVSSMRRTGTDWGVLTNGVQFELLERETDEERPDEPSLGAVSLSELPENSQLLRVLSRDSIETGEAARIADELEPPRRRATPPHENEASIANRTNQRGRRGYLTSILVEVTAAIRSLVVGVVLVAFVAIGSLWLWVDANLYNWIFDAVIALLPFLSTNPLGSAEYSPEIYGIDVNSPVFFVIFGIVGTTFWVLVFVVREFVVDRFQTPLE